MCAIVSCVTPRRLHELLAITNAMLAESGEAVRVVAPSWIVDGGAAATANRRAGRATADGEGDGDDKFESSLTPELCRARASYHLSIRSRFRRPFTPLRALCDE